MYENFSAPRTESLDSIFNRLQKINTHVVLWRNKPDLDTMSFDDLYNNFKIIKQDVKGTASSSLSYPNMAFVSSPSSTNEVNTAYGVSTANTQVSPASTQVSTLVTQTLGVSICRKKQLVLYKKKRYRNILCEQLDVLKRDISYKDSKISVLKSELEKLKQEKESNQLKIEKFDNDSKSLEKLIGSQITDKSRKGVGFVSYNAIPPPPTGLFSPPNLDLSNSGLEEFQQLEFEGYGPKTSKSVSEDTSNEVMESPDAPLVEKLLSNDKLEKKIVFPTANCNYHQRERVVSRNNYTRVNYNYYAKKAHPSAHKNIVPRAILMKTGLKPLNTARPVNTAHPKTTVNGARPMSCFFKSAQSTIQRRYQIRTILTNKKFSQKVNTAKGRFYTARPKAVNTARPNLAVVNVVRENQVNVVKASAC
ncbi:hypothetical protein Tco_1193219 [Tanacetum coccineum]